MAEFDSSLVTTCTEQPGEPRNAGCSIIIDRGIKAGLFLEVRSFYDKLKSEGWSPNLILLSSDGGDVEEALKLGRFFRSIGVTVLVQAGSHCYSSCVIVLAGGSLRGPIGEVGIHRPYFSEGAASVSEARTTYSRLRNEVQAFFVEGGVRPTLWDDMMSVPPEKIRILGLREMEDYGLSGVDPAVAESGARRLMQRYQISRDELNRRHREIDAKCAHESNCVQRVLETGR